MIHDLGYRSIFDACLEDVRTLAEGNEGRVLRQIATERGGIDELLRHFRDAKAFQNRKSTNSQETRAGMCQLSTKILLEEFDKLRLLEQLNYSLQEWNPKYLDAFNLDELFDVMNSAAPNLIQLFLSLSDVSPDSMGDEAKRARRYIVFTLAQLSHLRSNHSNFVPAMVTLFMVAAKATKRCLVPLNHIGVVGSYNSALRHLESAAHGALSHLK